MNYYQAVIELMKARPSMSIAEAKGAANELFSEGPKERDGSKWRFRFFWRGEPHMVSGSEETIDALVEQFKAAGLLR